MRSIGLAALRVGTVDDAVKKLKYGFYTAVLLDERCANVDSLEFVLNVRDVDPAVPILILGPSRTESVDDALRSQRGVYMIPHLKTPAQMAEALTNALEGKTAD
jgi:DNA-binding NtrC family response regulator